MPSKEDKCSEEYTYYWSNDSKTTLQEFLVKYKPSMVQDDGTKPWIWVSRRNILIDEAGEAKAIEEATAILKETTEKIEAIQNDDSIPLRASKKKGTKSKKEVRETTQAEASDKLKAISIEHKYVCGKWLIFASPDKVDMIWSTVATSLIEGPLASTCVYLAKVATSPRNESAHYQHVLCLYMPDVYDKESVIEVMKVLLRQHGLSLNGVKSDLYTAIGLDSKHPSGIPSTVWKNTALLKDTEIKDLRDQYFKELDAARVSAAAAADTNAPEKDDTTTADTSAKPKPKLKKKLEEDPFASDEEQQEPKAADKIQLENRAKGDNYSDEDGKKGAKAAAEDKRKAQLAALKAKGKVPSRDTRKRRKASDTDEEEADEEEVKPQKKRSVKK